MATEIFLVITLNIIITSQMPMHMTLARIQTKYLTLFYQYNIELEKTIVLMK